MPGIHPCTYYQVLDRSVPEFARACQMFAHGGARPWGWSILQSGVGFSAIRLSLSQRILVSYVIRMILGSRMKPTSKLPVIGSTYMGYRFCRRDDRLHVVTQTRSDRTETPPAGSARWSAPAAGHQRRWASGVCQSIDEPKDAGESAATVGAEPRLHEQPHRTGLRIHPKTHRGGPRIPVGGGRMPNHRSLPR